MVTPDGKTWDEVTRDVSYIDKNLCIQSSCFIGSATTGETNFVMDTWRGQTVAIDTKLTAFQKDFAIGHDMLVCLKAGAYKCWVQWYSHTLADLNIFIGKNQTGNTGLYGRSSGSDETAEARVIHELKRGDYIQIYLYGGASKDRDGRNLLIIERVG